MKKLFRRFRRQPEIRITRPAMAVRFANRPDDIDLGNRATRRGKSLYFPDGSIAAVVNGAWAAVGVAG